MIYFDNAATTFPKPPCVAKAVQEALVRYGANPGRGGHDLSIETARRVYRCRELAAQLFCCQPEQVVFTKNCTESLNIVIKGVLRPGDHVIISDLEHNAVYRVVDALARQGLITYSVAETCPSDEKTIWNFEHLIRPNTRLIVCTQGSNVFGVRVPVEKIGAMARRRGVLMAVDAAQTAGLLDINLRESAIDYLCLPGHKGLYGPQGTGGLVVAEGVEVPPFKVGGSGVRSFDEEHPRRLPESLEAGTLNAHGIAGLAAGVAFVERVGADAIAARMRALVARFEDGVRALDGVRVVGGRGGIDRCGIVAVVLEGVDAAEASARLYADFDICTRAGAHCAPLMHRALGTEGAGAVRFSFSHFTTEDEVDAAARALACLAREAT